MKVLVILTIGLMLGLLAGNALHAQERPFPDGMYHDDGHFNSGRFLWPNRRTLCGTNHVCWCYNDMQYVLRFTWADLQTLAMIGMMLPEQLEGDDLTDARASCGWEQ